MVIERRLSFVFVSEIVDNNVTFGIRSEVSPPAPESEAEFDALSPEEQSMVVKMSALMKHVETAMALAASMQDAENIHRRDCGDCDQCDEMGGDQCPQH